MHQSNIQNYLQPRQIDSLRIIPKHSPPVTYKQIKLLISKPRVILYGASNISRIEYHVKSHWEFHSFCGYTSEKLNECVSDFTAYEINNSTIVLSIGANDRRNHLEDTKKNIKRICQYFISNKCKTIIMLPIPNHKGFNKWAKIYAHEKPNTYFVDSPEDVDDTGHWSGDSALCIVDKIIDIVESESY
jgi:hypothetical protein